MGMVAELLSPATGAPSHGTPGPVHEAAPPPRKQHVTTRALRAWRPYLTNTQIGVLEALIRTGISFETGVGRFTYGAVQGVARLSRRQLMRHAKVFHCLGVVTKEHTYWELARPAGDHNRANIWRLGLPVERHDIDPELEELLASQEAQWEGCNEDEQPGQQGPTSAPVAPVEARPGAIAATSAPEKAAAPVAAAGCSSGPGEATANRPVVTRGASAVLGMLRAHDELAGIATEAVASRLHRVGERNQKTMVQIELAIGDAADKALDEHGRPLDRKPLIDFVIGCIKREKRTERPVGELAQKTAEELAAAKAREAEQRRRYDELAAAELAQKRRAASALAAGITVAATGPPRG